MGCHPLGIGRIHTGIDLRVPFFELVVANTVQRLDHVALITRGNLMELVTVLSYAWNGRGGPGRLSAGGAHHQSGRCGRGGGRDASGGGRGGGARRGDSADHAVVPGDIKVGALGVGVQLLESLNSDSPA